MKTLEAPKKYDQVTKSSLSQVDTWQFKFWIRYQDMLLFKFKLEVYPIFPKDSRRLHILIHEVNGGQLFDQFGQTDLTQTCQKCQVRLNQSISSTCDIG